MRILISVIDPRECASFSRWPDFLDVKNPLVGSLGMPDHGVVDGVRKFVGEGVEISAAIGDAKDDAKLYSKRAVSAAAEGADIIKVGLYSFQSRRSAVRFLQQVGDSLRTVDPRKRIVPALYADRADEDLIQKFPRLARDAGAWGCLLDTYDKKRGPLSAHLDPSALKNFVFSCRDSGVVSALAGGLRIEDLGWLKEVAPDIAGFRSAVAIKGRAAIGVDQKKIDDLFSATAASRPIA